MPDTALEDLTVHQLCAFAARRKAFVRLADATPTGGCKRDDRLAGQVIALKKKSLLGAEPLHVAGSNEALVQDDQITLQSQCAFHINGSYAYRSRGHRRCDQLRRAHGHGGHSEHWDRSPDFR